MIITVIVSILLILLVYLAIFSNKDCGCSSYGSNNYYKDNKENYSDTENINNRIDRALSNYRSDLSKYNVSAKSYEYDFIPNEQPLNGLSPDFTKNYPSTLKKSNKMFVEPDLTINYTNLLNTSNNSLKNYIY